jgi:hypothetical protein
MAFCLEWLTIVFLHNCLYKLSSIDWKMGTFLYSIKILF